jgi:hypothetical protein
MDVHDTNQVTVEARDIGTFWTIRFDVIDDQGNLLAVDLYVQNFREETMKRHATALQEGADAIRELFKAKQKAGESEE